MTEPPTESAIDSCVSSRIEQFKLYDRYVDIVSIFEMLFLSSNTDIPATVAHFERFPSIPSVDKPLTPDFTVAFKDGSAIVGEIARFSLREESVDDLCAQLNRYADLDEVPVGPGTRMRVDRLEILLLVPLDLGVPALVRILEDRLKNPDHAFKPRVVPAISQFGFSDSKYIIQLPLHPSNGTISDGARPGGLGHILRTGSLNCKPERFEDVKANRAFMNDPVDDLYLATHLWGKTLPVLVEATTTERPAPISIEPSKVAEQLRSQHGTVRAADVTRALRLLETARLARRESDGTWTIAWEEVHAAKGRDLALTLAELVCKKPKSGAIDRLPKPPAAPVVPNPTLFD